MSTRIMHQHNIIINNIIYIKHTLYTTYYMFCCVKMNSILSNEYTYLWLILINYDLSKSVSKTVLEVYN